jgi:hypothetical protein
VRALAAVLPNPSSRWCVSDPLPPSAALPLTEGENKALTLQALISPREGESRAERARGSLTHHLATFFRRSAADRQSRVCHAGH